MDLNKFNYHGKGTSESIYIAALTNDAAYIIKYAEQGKNIHIQDERNQTLLHLATRNKALQSLALLLQLGVDPNIGDKYGDTPLHIAAFMGNDDIVKILLENKADPNQTNHKNESPLAKAAFKGSIPCMDLLIAHKADIYHLDEQHTSVMQNAVRSKKIKAVKYLIDQGAIINSLDIRSNSTFHYAAQYSRVDIVTYLIERGVNPYSKNNYLLTPLHIAIEHPDFEMLHVFLDSGLTSYDKSKWGLSPYDEANQKYRYEAVEIFDRLKNDKVYQSKIKSNALTLAIIRNQFDLAESLIPRSNINLRDNFDNTPLFYAIMNQDEYLVEKLIKHDASIYNIDRMGLDAIYYAVLTGNKQIVSSIMKKQVDLSKKYLGYTALEYAIHNKLEDIIELLQ